MPDTVIATVIKNKETDMKYSYHEIKSYIFQPIEIHDDELNFKVDVLKQAHTDSVKGQLWRLETYRVQPSFVSNIQADESIYVQDNHTIPDLKDQVFDDTESCLQFIIAELKKKFSNT